MPDLTYLHPMVVHFPIALLIVGFAFDIVSLFVRKEFFLKAGLYLLILGAAGAVAAFISGNLAGEGVAEGGSLQQAIGRHEEAATLTLWILGAAVVVRLASIVFRKFESSLRWLGVILFLAGALSVSRTAHLGGQLVYNHAAGVQLKFDMNALEEGADTSVSPEKPAATKDE